MKNKGNKKNIEIPKGAIIACIIIVSLVIISCTLVVNYLIVGFHTQESYEYYYVTDKNDSIEKIEKYLVKYFKSEYNDSVTLRYVKKEIGISCSGTLFGCPSHKESLDIYKYVFDGTSKSGKSFWVTYTEQYAVSGLFGKSFAISKDGPYVHTDYEKAVLEEE